MPCFPPPLEANDAGLRVTEDAPYRWTWPEIGKAIGVPEASVCSHPAIMADFQMPFLARCLPTHQGEDPLYMDPVFAATTACHVMHQVQTGRRLYIRPLGGPQLCPGLDDIRARPPHEHNGLVGADNLSRV